MYGQPSGINLFVLRALSNGTKTPARCKSLKQPTIESRLCAIETFAKIEFLKFVKAMSKAVA